MAKSGFDSYSRRSFRTRRQNNIILVVCGGDTEAIYFRKFNIDIGEIRVKTVLEGRNPMNIVKRAIEEAKQGFYRQVWCVFDKDEFPDYDEAILFAKSNGIEAAYSNQAFELWYILHFERKNCALDRRHYKRILEEHIGREYNKTDEYIYSALKDRTKKAIENAKWGHQMHKIQSSKPSQWESSTTVYRLAEELLRWKK